MDSGSHSSPGSHTIHLTSGVLGLACNKRGVSLQVSPAHRTGRAAVLPPLQFYAIPEPEQQVHNSMLKISRETLAGSQHKPIPRHTFKATHLIDLPVPMEKDETMPWINACHSILFAAQSIEMALQRCATQGNLVNALLVSLGHLKTKTDSLAVSLESFEAQTSRPSEWGNLLKDVGACVAALKHLTNLLRAQPVTTTHDLKLIRYILLSVRGATVDVKEAWDMVSTTTKPSLTTVSCLPTAKDLSQRSLSNPISSKHWAPLSDHRSSTAVESFPQQHDHLESAVANSLQVIHLLKQAIQDAIASTALSTSVKKPLLSLLEQSDQTLVTALCLKKTIADADDSISKQRMDEDARHYLEAMVSLMSAVRSVATKEEFQWPKAVKQGCLQLTRIITTITRTRISNQLHCTHALGAVTMNRSLSTDQ